MGGYGGFTIHKGSYPAYIILKGTSFVQCISPHINAAPIKRILCHPGSLYKADFILSK